MDLIYAATNGKMGLDLNKNQNGTREVRWQNKYKTILQMGWEIGLRG